MEVIKHGNTYKEIECPRCGALLSYCKTDIKKDNRIDYYFGEHHYIHKEYVTCIECKTMIKLKYLIDGEEQKI